jgi:DNA-binding FadR family transcriptional regulator
MSDINNANPIETLSLVDKVELRLMEYISRKDVNPGDSIPKELELSKNLGVSRTVIREAVSRLRMLGLIESRKHKGMVVTNPDVLSNFERVLKPQIIDEETLIDLFELRIVLEIGMGDMLFANITPADIEELEQIIALETGNSDKGVFEIEEELRFHGKLYEISGNKTLKRFQELLLPIFEFVNESEIFQPFNVEQDRASHKDLVQVIKFGTPEIFQNTMKIHLKPHFERLQKKRKLDKI